ncbi:nucleotidyltransferase domain-containing protein [Planococcus sp. N064]|uniref:Nucleotidyltransferase domain-containing protein n=1 Tax=Planococcus liqunii TaxID=3058394 RepID=A0ABT8MLL7_9BACL|nr:nucleotidyltransferase domain-containing protein [Planococcus sp. N064]MDN7225766.1 nucleotidyltransferase domain-containing protein [Planococcus sp. N064]
MNGDATKTARELVAKRFPDCETALLAGSVVRGEATSTSDLDLIVIDNNIMSSYRESFIEKGWPVELFVHNSSSYQEYFKSDCERGQPSLPNMVAESIVLTGQQEAEHIKKEARKLLAKGPACWTPKEAEVKRYFLTDALDDFIGTNNRTEELFIANALAEQLGEFVLRINGQWTGTSKWLVRSLKRYNEDFAKQFLAAFERYYSAREKEAVIQLAEAVLHTYGGRLFDGFAQGKEGNLDERRLLD